MASSQRHRSGTDAGRAQGVGTMGDAGCLRAAAVPDKHPGQMGLDISASHDSEGNMDRAPRALPTRIPIQEIARHAPVHICEAPRRRRRRPRACAAHGRALAGRSRIKCIHVPRPRRVLRHDAFGFFAPVVVRVRRDVEGHAGSFKGVPLHSHWTHS